MCAWYKPNNWPSNPRTIAVTQSDWKPRGGVEVVASSAKTVTLGENTIFPGDPAHMNPVTWENMPTYSANITADQSEGYFVFQQHITIPLPSVVMAIIGSEQVEVGLFLQLKTDPSFTDGTYSPPEGVTVTANGFGKAFIKTFGQPKRQGSQWVTDFVLALRSEQTEVVPIPHLVFNFTVESTGKLIGVSVDYDVVVLAAWFVSAVGLRVNRGPQEEEEIDDWELLPLA